MKPIPVVDEIHIWILIPIHGFAEPVKYKAHCKTGFDSTQGGARGYIATIELSSKASHERTAWGYTAKEAAEKLATKLGGSLF